jgi:hypothetical protein
LPAPILFLALALWFAWFRWSHAHAVRRLMAEAAARGEPLTPADVGAMYPPVPDTSNAAVGLVAAWSVESPNFWRDVSNHRRLAQWTVPEPTPPPAWTENFLDNGPEAQMDDRRLAEAQEYLHRTAASREAVRKALALPEARFPIRFEDSAATCPFHAVALRLASRNFEIEAAVLGQRGDVTGALGAIEASARIVALLGPDPEIEAQRRRALCVRSVVRQMERLLSRQAVEGAVLGRLENVLGATALGDGPRRALLADRAIMLSAVYGENDGRFWDSDIDRTKSDVELAREHRRVITLLRVVGLRDLDEHHYLEGTDRLLRIGGGTTVGAIRVAREVTAAYDRGGRMFPPLILTEVVWGHSRAVEVYAGAEASRRAALAAVAVERLRLADNGKIPATLSDAVQPVPEDPFSGGPIRFERRDRGYVVYSVGADGNDDHGLRRRKIRGHAETNYDIVFAVAR